jgi:hypothetical protein
MPNGNNHPQGRILAVAFTDLNGNDKFDGKDALQSAVVDTNGDNKIDVGDTVQFGTFPLHLDGTGVGHFLEKSETITQVFQDSPNDVLVSVADGNIVWSTDATQQNWSTATGFGGQLGIGIGDAITANFNDTIEAHAGVGPGMPDSTVAESAFQPGDQPFLDVFIA